MKLTDVNIFAAVGSSARGATIVEFGIVAPVVLFAIICSFDVGHGYFVKAILDGATENAARLSSMESAATVEAQREIDNRLRQTVVAIAPTATIEPKRRHYRTFAASQNATPEIVNETAGRMNRNCDEGETFIDSNGNGVWDADGGSEGQGGPKDVAVLTYDVKYPRLFPMGILFGLSPNVELKSTSILANQPYGEQAPAGTGGTRHCT